MSRCTVSRVFMALAGLLIATGPALHAGEFKGTATFSPDKLEITKRDGFDFVSLGDSGCTTLAGAPSLPVVQIHIALPVDASFREVRVSSIRSMELEGRFHLAPVTKPVKVSGQAPEEPFQKDSALYGRNEDFPGIHAEKIGAFDLAGQDFVTLNLYPVQYNPVTGKLKLITAMDFEAIYQDGSNSSREEYNFSRKIRDRYTKILKNMAFNPGDVSPIPSFTGGVSTALEPGQYECVILTLFTFIPGFEPLAEWRNQMGIPTKIVNSLWVYMNYDGATNEEKVRNFIIDAHVTWGAVYFLLGGDTNYMPYDWTYLCGENIPNDTYYSDYDDDWVCELAVGRAPINTMTDVDRFVDKVLTYEKSPPDNYGDTVFFMGFDLDASTQSENCKKSIKNLWVPPDVTFEREWDSEAGDHIGDVINYMNAGQNLVNHIDHCNTSFIGIACVNHGTGFDGGWAQSFTNGTRYSNFYTLGCWPGNYPDTCWGEYFVRDDQGGITFVGNSRSGWYNPGYYNTLSHRYEKKWWRALYDNNAYRAGDTLATSLNLYYPPDDLYKYIFTELNLLGDPVLHLWTKNPVPLSVSHPEYVNTGAGTLKVHVEGNGAPLMGALACAMKGDEVYAYGTTGAGGDVDLDIDPLTPGDLLITVTAQNFRHYQTNIPAEPAPVLLAIEPRCGPEAGLTAVTISGANFYKDPETKVKIGGNDLFAMEVKDPSTITGYTPLGANGWHDVEILSPFGGDALAEGFRYFPTGGAPFNGADIHVESITAPADVTLIASGKALNPYIAFLSYGGGPTPTAYGIMGLDAPIFYLYASNLNAQGFGLLPLSLAPGLGPLDFYIHLLGLDGSGNPVWSLGGNNPNGTGGLWFHLNN